jgi:hypothetical protein
MTAPMHTREGLLARAKDALFNIARIHGYKLNDVELSEAVRAVTRAIGWSAGDAQACVSPSAIDAGAQALANDVWHPPQRLENLSGSEANKFRRQARLVLEAASLVPSTAPAQSSWQPIETAPKDGTLIEVKGMDGPYGVTSFEALARWSTPTNWHKDQSNWTSPAGAVLALAGYKPSHWRPRGSVVTSTERGGSE